MARSTFDLDIRGLLGAEEQLALLNLPHQLRRRLLNNVSKRVRSASRQRIRNQQNLDGSPFEARKGSSKGKKKMEAG
ncbi:virion morphogenesis protein, partial [Pseudomonas sp. NS1(2017)]|uniref:phage virion morphogenesis protein n=1 Tax=Pseudomonas sp. NS1(2017) TaxID=2025658 RepID=UPI000BB9CD95